MPLLEGMGYELPAEDDAPHKCVTLSIPNDEVTIANFVGALSTLALWINYRRDPDKRGKDIAQVWKQIVQSIEFSDCAIPTPGGDDVQFRQQDCLLQYSIDCEHWYTLYDPTNCVPETTVQPGSGTRPPNGECKSYTVALSGANKWLLPFGVQAGDTITITGATGAWSDSTAQWNCPDGTPYILGLCFGAAGHVMGDPDASSWHMQLIGLLNGVYFPASSGTYTVPTGTPISQLVLQANDAVLADNSGSIQFTIEVCNGGEVPPSDWCFVYDFTISPGDWAAYSPGGADRARWVAGQGWAPATAQYQGLVQIQSDPFTDSEITSVTVNLSTVLNGPDNYACINLPDRFGPDNCITSGVLTEFTYSPVTPSSSTGIFLNMAADDDSPVTPWAGYIRSVIIRGNGTSPFGGSNC